MCVESEPDSLQSDASPILRHLPCWKVGEEARMEKQYLSQASRLCLQLKTKFHILFKSQFPSAVDGNPTLQAICSWCHVSLLKINIAAVGRHRRGECLMALDWTHISCCCLLQLACQEAPFCSLHSYMTFNHMPIY